MVYDGAGNLVTDTYTRGDVGDGQRVYDGEGRVVFARVTGGVGEWGIYDAFGRRVRVTREGSAETRYVYGIDGEVVAEYGDGQIGSGTPRVEYGYRLGEVVVEGRSSGVSWRVSDGLGSVRMVLDGSGSLSGVGRLDYAPFGEELTTQGGRSVAQGYGALATRHRYTGHERDASSGYDHTLFRKLDSVLGRWTSPDPYLGSATVENPQSWNRYAYVENDPVNAMDPLGLVPIDLGNLDTITVYGSSGGVNPYLYGLAFGGTRNIAVTCCKV